MNYFAYFLLAFVSVVTLSTLSGAQHLQARLGEKCDDVNYFCAPNMTCNRAHCECNATYFPQDFHELCIQRVVPGDRCDTSVFDIRQCMDNAYCDSRSRKCMCFPGFVSNGNLCMSPLRAGSDCDDQLDAKLVDDQCDGIATCANVTDKNVTRTKCVCPDGYYDNLGECEPRLSPQSTCTSKVRDEKQCVNNSQCIKVSSDYICMCRKGYYVGGGHCHQPIGAGESCDYKNPEPGQCVANAECDLKVRKCVCDEGYFMNGDQCVQRIFAGQQCDNVSATIEQDKQCVHGSICDFNVDQNRTECTCDSNQYYNKAGECTDRLVANVPCDYRNQDPYQCGDHAKCDTKIRMCVCDPGYFDRKGICKELVDALGTCDLSYEDSTHIAQCTHHAHCEKAGCVCDRGYFKNDTDCIPRLSVGSICDDVSPGSVIDHTKQCANFSTCQLDPVTNNTLCTCLPAYYNNHDVCVQRLHPSSPCDTKLREPQCVDNALCDAKARICVCEHGYYDHNGVCTTLLEPETMTCDPSFYDATMINPCTYNSHCDDNVKKCYCNQGFYTDGPVCSPKIGAGQACNESHPAGDQQCVQDSTCAPDSATNTSLCTCGQDYYADSGTCVQRVEANSVCSLKVRSDRQCVNNAACDRSLQVCACNHLYYDQVGHCLPEIGVGEKCSVTYTETTGVNPCVAHAHCDTGSARCLCEEGFYGNYTECLPQISLGQSCDLNLTSPDSQCVAHGECSANAICECKSGYYKFDSTTCKLPLAASSVCDPKNVDPDQCISNASCNAHLLMCECGQGFFSQAGRCKPRLSEGQKCDSQIHDLFQCPDHADCVNDMCECEEGYFDTKGACNPIVGLGQTCDSSNLSPEQCIDNADCLNDTCVCSQSFYESSGTCSLRLSAGSICDPSNLDPHQCADFAACNGSHPDTPSTNTCQCFQGFYEMDGSCRQRKVVGEACMYDFRDQFQCVDDAHCSVGKVCECDKDFFPQDAACFPRIEVNFVCNSSLAEPLQCVEYASCLNDTCVCQADFYPKAGACVQRVPAMVDCTSSDQCVGNSVCNGTVNYKVCQCDSGFYDKGGDCEPSLQVGEECIALITDPAQCVPGAACVSYQLSNSASGFKCACDDQHYALNRQCYARALTGGACNATASAGDAQCMDNALCDTQYNTCICAPGFYSNSGVCVPQLKLGGPCNPNITDLMQCGSYSECTQDTHLCQCSYGYYDNGGNCAKHSNLGGQCDPKSLDPSQCPVSSHCEATLRCECDRHFYHFHTVCLQRIVLGDMCDVGISAADQCDDSNAACMTVAGGATCACNREYQQLPGQARCTLRPPGSIPPTTPSPPMTSAAVTSTPLAPVITAATQTPAPTYSTIVPAITSAVCEDAYDQDCATDFAGECDKGFVQNICQKTCGLCTP